MPFNFSKVGGIIKAVKVVPELFKLANQSCYMEEQLIPCGYDDSKSDLDPLWHHLRYIFNYTL